MIEREVKAFELTEKELDKILPCPFCSVESFNGFTDGKGYWISCDECQCNGPYAPSRIAVVFAWNRRPGRTVDARLEELEQMKS